MDEKSNNDPVAKALNINPLETSSDAIKTLIAEAHNDSASVDFETARSNILTLIENGNEAIFKLSDIANQSQHPRAFEVVGNLMKQVADINSQLMDLHQQKQKLDAPKEAAKNVTNNAIFVGSTSELNKLIDKMNKGD